MRVWSAEPQAVEMSRSAHPELLRHDLPCATLFDLGHVQLEEIVEPGEQLIPATQRIVSSTLITRQHMIYHSPGLTHRDPRTDNTSFGVDKLPQVSGLSCLKRLGTIMG